MRDRGEDEGTKSGLPGSRTLSRYWEDLMNVSRHALRRHIMLSASTYQQVLLGAGPGQILTGMGRAWLDWASTILQLGTFPIEWLSREMMHVPTLVIMVDPVAETTAPATTAIPISAAGLTVGWSDLDQLGGTARIAAAHLGARLLAEENQVEVWLSDLGGTKEEREHRGIRPGHYVGIVYAEEAPTRRPLVIVHAVIA